MGVEVVTFKGNGSRLIVEQWVDRNGRPGDPYYRRLLPPAACSISKR